MPYLKLSKDKITLEGDEEKTSSNYTDYYVPISAPGVHGGYDFISGTMGYDLPDMSKQYKAKKVVYTIKLSTQGYGQGEATITFENPLCENGRFYYKGIETNSLEGKLYSEDKVVGSIAGTGLLQGLSIFNSPIPGPTAESYPTAVSSIDIPEFLVYNTEDTGYFFLIRNFYFDKNMTNSKVYIDRVHFAAFDDMESPYVGYTGTMIMKTGENGTFTPSDFSSWTSSNTGNLVTYQNSAFTITIQVSIEDLHYYSKSYDYPIVVEKLSLMDENGEIYTFNLSKLIEAKLLDKN